MSDSTGERTAEQAFHRGCAAILVAIAATFAIVFALMWLCGCELPGDALLVVPTALVAAAWCELRSRVAGLGR